MISYNFKNGPLDQLLDDLVGNSREALITNRIRQNNPILQGQSSNPNHTVRNEKGIFAIKDGKAFRSFLYLKRARVHSFGLPKRHYFNCEKAQENLPWVLSNQDAVRITCSETHEIYNNIPLDLCGYCLQVFRNLTATQLTGQSFDNLILEMENNNITKTKEIGLDGYVLNWNEISTAYRRTKDFTCEHCGITDADGTYMHTHHINYDKMDNSTDNLRCLCIVCHANVDDIHRQNFSTPYQKRVIRKFKAKTNRS